MNLNAADKAFSFNNGYLKKIGKPNSFNLHFGTHFPPPPHNSIHEEPNQAKMNVAPVVEARSGRFSSWNNPSTRLASAHSALGRGPSRS